MTFLLDPEVNARVDAVFADLSGPALLSRFDPIDPVIGGRLAGRRTGLGRRGAALFGLDAPAIPQDVRLGSALLGCLGPGGQSRATPENLSLLLDGGDVIRALLTVQAEFRGDTSFQAPIDWLRLMPGERDPLPAQVQYGYLGTLTANVMCMGLHRESRKVAAQILQVAFGVDPVNATIRSRLMGPLGGGNDPLHLGLPVPPKLLPFDDVMASTCLGSLREGLGALGAAAGGLSRGIATVRIRSLVPDTGCGGVAVQIMGAGFGATAPATAAVLFAAYGGGVVAGQITRWSDTEIDVVTPANVGYGPVRLVGLADDAAAATFADAAAGIGQAASACLGPGAARAGQIFARLPLSAAVNGLEVATALFKGGPPTVRAFKGNGQSPRILMRSNQMLRLEWDVDNAADVRIQTVGTGNIPPMNRVFPPKGALDIGPLSGAVGWTEQLRLDAANACGATQVILTVEMRDLTALVLAGGGAKGCFEAGAVRCLYDVFGLRPDLITGTSAGSLNALKLSEGPAAVPALEAMWLGLTGPSDMFQVTPLVRSILQQWQILGILPQQFFELSQMLGVQITEYNWVSPEMEIAIGISKNVFSQAVSTNGLFLITDILFKGLKAGLALGKLIDAIKALLDSGQSLFLFDPVADLINRNVDRAKVAGSGIDLRITVVDLNSGRTRYATQGGQFADDGEGIDLFAAVQASASIPVVFPPVASGTGVYCDGGLRENIAIAAADSLGASRVVAVVPSPLGVARADYRSEPIGQIALRSAEAIMDEQQFNDYHPHRGFGCPVTVIAPTFEVHNLFRIDPGLIQINMDYGYMRAYDVMQANAPIRRQLTGLSDAITRLRMAIWGSEHRADGQYTMEEAWGFVSTGLQRTPSADALAEVRRLKLQLRDLFRQRVASSGTADCNPRGIERAWQQWERQVWQPLIPSPWDATTAHVGPALPQVQPPGPL